MDASTPQVDLSILSTGDELGGGGQGKVFDVRSVLIEGRWPAVLKLYSQEALSQLNASTLEKIVTFAHQLPAKDRGWLYENYAWPAVLVMQGSDVRGFLMRKAPPGYHFGFRTQTQGVLQKLREVAYLLNTDDYLTSAGLQVTDRDRVRILEATATSLSRLHGMNVAIGDLSPKNILFRLQPNPSSFFLDCDSVRLDGETALQQLETGDWEAPAGEPSATIATDSYKFGLLAIRLFARDQSTDDTSAIAAISPVLGRLARLSQDPDDSRRPTPGQWVGALKATARSLPTVSATSAGSPTSDTAGDDTNGAAPSYPAERLPALARWLLRRASLLVLAAMAVFALLFFFVIQPALSGSRQPVKAVDPAAQVDAATINALLNRSVASQFALEIAMDHVESCSDLAADDSQINTVVAQRASELSEALGLPTAALANGVSLRASLVEVLRISLHADQEYLLWTTEVNARGCSAHTLQDTAYARGYALTEDVVAAKLDFLRLWNRAAPVYGFQPRSQSGI